MVLRRTRTFGNRTYNRVAVIKYKEDAKDRAESERKKGYKARVIKSHGVWEVYRKGVKKWTKKRRINGKIYNFYVQASSKAEALRKAKWLRKRQRQTKYPVSVRVVSSKKPRLTPYDPVRRRHVLYVRNLKRRR